MVSVLADPSAVAGSLWLPFHQDSVAGGLDPEDTQRRDDGRPASRVGWPPTMDTDKGPTA